MFLNLESPLRARDVPTITSTGGGQILTDASADDHIGGTSATQTITGTAVASDVDANDGDGADGADDFTWSIDGAATTTYGTLVFDNSGVGGDWTFTTDAAAFNELTHGQRVPITYRVQASDPQNALSAAMDLTFMLEGVNDRPELAVTPTDVNVIEAGGVNNAAIGDAMANGSLTITDPDTGHNAFTFAGNTLQGRAGTSGAFKNANGVDEGGVTSDGQIIGTYGTLTLERDGTWSYALRDDDLETQALRGATGSTPAQMVQDVFNIQLVNVDGTTQTSAIVPITIDVTGADDAPDDFVVTSQSTDTAVTEDDSNDTTATGAFVITDPLAGATYNYSGAFRGNYGNLTVDEDGNWTYTIDNAAAQVLNAGPTEDLITVTIIESMGGVNTGRSVDHVITITVNGVNEPTPAPVFSGASEPTGTVTDTDTAFDNTPDNLMGRSILLNTVTGDISWSVAPPVVAGDTTETDAAYFGELTFPGSVFVDFGTAFDRTGSGLPWQFDPTTGINDLGAGKSVTITYVVTASNAGGSATQDLVITLMGIDDAPEITSGLTGNVC